ncbi:menaquinol-cytochrome c reductase cytochrome b subunit [Sphaerisporangium krabiense]|uniref:Cytochrome bc1 complex cytochrome b subunit n=1 Tax=Sphaerisporangium krabiense TaxID=763782 RepID=A0A7W9DS72_9ACTN|nr:ubiquinol-cytochrome c reductase cytochrome b subunit [Sphaerisporangium krabiense]MBB5628884.1 ubiquinol-cytochrome c reductase cytochrome b subunit [Sphaerisporangium krabiense]GII60275.1 menaquinol-cytochrome c reductase cytochrome b subunit [Sphaerisporangium krabiense]
MTFDGPPKLLAERAEFIDDRLGAASWFKRNLRKVFPDHWSFLLGEIALYTFVILILTGVFLTFWFRPSMGELVYRGSYQPLYGLRMSEAYASTLHISFDVRGGLLVRQIHHWAALLFVAAITVHMLRVFFTGAYRKPRDINWTIGVLLFALALGEGLTGYSLPDDLLSGAGLRITQGVIIGVPIVGTYLSFLLFGGEYPGQDVIARFFSMHILLIPGALLALVSAHLVLMWVQKHTQMPGKGRTETNVVGGPFYPSFMAKSTAYFVVTFGALALLATAAQINPIWLFGPYTPSSVSSGSQPDWYMGFLEGSLRLMPSWEWNFLGHTVPLSVLVPAFLPIGIIFVGLLVYPAVERWITGDDREHHLCDRPRNNPHRTAIGAAAITFYGVLWLMGTNDWISARFHIPLYSTTQAGRLLIFLGPVVAYVITHRLCVALQRRDLETLSHGVESGVIKRLPNGEYVEVHVPPLEELADVVRGKKAIPVIRAGPDGGGVIPVVVRHPLGRLRARLSEGYARGTTPVPPPPRTSEEERHEEVPGPPGRS